MKEQLIRKIEAIYRDLGYERQGRPLASFSEKELREHLSKLEAGECAWMKAAFKRTDDADDIPF